MLFGRLNADALTAQSRGFPQTRCSRCDEVILDAQGSLTCCASHLHRALHQRQKCLTAKCELCRLIDMHPITCVVVHPSPLVREGFRSILAKSPFEPVCTASSAEDVPSAVAGAGKQLLVLIGVREAGELTEAVSAAKIKFPSGQVVVVGDCAERDLVLNALRSGATSVLDENVPITSLVKELELVAQGEPVISVLVLKRLLAHCSGRDAGVATLASVQPAPPVAEPAPTNQLAPVASELTPGTQETEPSVGLSRREAAILNALVQGASNKLIAHRLGISEATVKVHVKAILRKIRAKNRTQAAIWALHHQTRSKPVDLGKGELPAIGNGRNEAAAAWK